MVEAVGSFSQDSEEVQCGICFDSLLPTDAIELLPCGHTNFCEACIMMWLSQASTCPLCRSEVTSPTCDSSDDHESDILEDDDDGTSEQTATDYYDDMLASILEREVEEEWDQYRNDGRRWNYGHNV
jgi:hypothetical protein